jgi:3-deoxy-D-manno-octulosonic-acid transferase
VGLERVIHQYAPVDIPASVDSFLKFWKPKLTVFIESEIWPNLLVSAAKKNKVILLNARLSDKSYSRWKNNFRTAKFLFSKFTHILPWSLKDGEKLKHFVGSKKIHYIGNLKFASPAPSARKTEIAQLRKEIGKRPFWLAASTHKGEEQIILTAHDLLKKKFPHLLTIIMPRHPSRGAEVLEKCSNRTTVLRSTGQKVSSNTDIYIANTLGEVGLFYNLTDIVFVGGSLIPHGGQNILEPARCNCALITGVHTDNFSEIIDSLKATDAIKIASSAEEIADNVEHFLSSETVLNSAAKNALSVANKANSILDDTVNFIGKLIKNNGTKN